jgi:hypothetical protein
VVSSILSETVLSEGVSTTIDGDPLLPNLETLAVPLRTKRMLSKEEKERARVRGISVKGIKVRFPLSTSSNRADAPPLQYYGTPV